jgi:hypothetical protein
MDHTWAAERLKEFRDSIQILWFFDSAEGEKRDELLDDYGPPGLIFDRLVSLDPVMRELMEAARPGLGEYAEPPARDWAVDGSKYWREVVKNRVLQAIGIHELGAEARKRMRPDSPDLVADQFHPWVWEAAAPLWHAGSRQEAVHAAARSVNAHLQQKLGRRDASESSLVREAFSRSGPSPGHPRLRFPGDRTSLAWCSRQNGAMDLGAGCFEGIRNPAAHEDGLVLPEQIALEQLAVFSVLARWIDECEVDIMQSGEIRIIKKTRPRARRGGKMMIGRN